MDIEVSDVTFARPGGPQLTGILHRPASPSRGLVLAHCFTCSKDLPASRRLADELAKADIAVLRFDFTGLGTSHGDFEASTLRTDVLDLAAAAQHMIALELGTCVLMGHSLGGAAALLAARKVRGLDAVITVGSPADAKHVEHLFADNVDAIHEEGCKIVELAGRPFPITDAFLHALEDAGTPAAGLDLPHLVIHGTDDDLVAFENAQMMMDAEGGPRTLVARDDIDHLLTKPSMARAVAADVVDWLKTL